MEALKQRRYIAVMDIIQTGDWGKLIIRKVDHDFITSNYDEIMSDMHRQRKERIERFNNTNARDTSIVAGKLLQEIVENEMGIRVGDLEIVQNENGKPSIKSQNDFFYSISHSGDYVGIAYSNRQIGLDIEKIRPCREKVAKRCFTPDECSYITSVPEREDEFFCRIWTMKESYLKLLGLGISVPLNSFNANPYNMTVSDEKFRYYEIKLDGYIVMLCVENT